MNRRKFIKFIPGIAAAGLVATQSVGVNKIIFKELSKAGSFKQGLDNKVATPEDCAKAINLIAKSMEEQGLIT